MGQQALQQSLEQLNQQLQEFDAHDLPNVEMRRAIYKLYEMMRAISLSLNAIEREFNDAFEAFTVLGNKMEDSRSSNLISSLFEKSMEAQEAKDADKSELPGKIVGNYL